MRGPPTSRFRLRSFLQPTVSDHWLSVCTTRQMTLRLKKMKFAKRGRCPAFARTCRPQRQIADCYHSTKLSFRDFGGLVLGCIDASGSEKWRIVKIIFSRSTRLTYFFTELKVSIHFADALVFLTRIAKFQNFGELNSTPLQLVPLQLV